MTSGWGDIDNEDNQPDSLHAVQLPFIPWEQCKKKYAAALDIVTENMVCAGGEAKKDTCFGDSGGEDHAHLVLICPTKESTIFLKIK